MDNNTESKGKPEIESGLDQKDDAFVPHPEGKLSDTAPKGWSYESLVAESNSALGKLPSYELYRSGSGFIPSPFPYPLTWLVLPQVPPTHDTYLKSGDRAFLRERTVGAQHTPDYHDVEAIDLDYLDLLGPEAVSTLLSLAIPAVLGVPGRSTTEADLQSTSVARKPTKFAHYAVSDEESGELFDIGEKDSGKVVPHLTLDSDLLGVGFPGHLSFATRFAGAVKIDKAFPSYKSYPFVIGDESKVAGLPRGGPMEVSLPDGTPLDSSLYFTSVTYLNNLRARVAARADLTTPDVSRYLDMWEKMGERPTNIANNLRDVEGAFHAYRKYAVPKVLEPPFLFEHEHIRRHVDSDLTKMTPIVYSEYSIHVGEPEIRVVFNRAEVLASGIGQVLDVPASESPAFQAFRERYLMEGRGTGIRVTLPKKDAARCVFEVGCWFLHFPRQGVMQHFFRQLCTDMALICSISSADPYNDIVTQNKTAAWNGQIRTLYFDYLTLCASVQWVGVVVRGYDYRPDIVYIPAYLHEAYLAVYPDYPFGKFATAAIANIDKVVMECVQRCAHLEDEFTNFISACSKHSKNKGPAFNKTGLWFSANYFRGEIDFYRQLLCSAETHWDTPMPTRDDEEYGFTEISLNPFCLLVHPPSHDSRPLDSHSALFTSDEQIVIPAPSIEKLISRDFNRSMKELFHLCFMWGFARNIVPKTKDLYVYFSMRIFTSMCGIAVGDQFKVDKELFTHTSCKRFPSFEVSKYPAELVPFVTYGKFLYQWFTTKGRGVWKSHSHNLGIIDDRLLHQDSVKNRFAFSDLMIGRSTLPWKLDKDIGMYLPSAPSTMEVVTPRMLMDLFPRLSVLRPSRMFTRLAGHKTGLKVNEPLFSAILLKARTFSPEVKTYEAEEEHEEIKMTAVPALKRNTHGTEEFSVVQCEFPVVPAPKDGLTPNVEVRYAPCDEKGVILRPWCEVKVKDNQVVLLETSSSTLRSLYDKGTVLARPFEVISRTTCNMLIPLRTLTNRPPVAMYNLAVAVPSS